MQCFLNGEYLPLSQARISPLDRGFLFGDGVYEVAPVYRRRPFHWRRHMARLAASLDKIRLPFDIAALDAPMQRLTADLPAAEQALYLQITRGEMQTRRINIAPAPAPTVFMLATPRTAPDAQKLAAGVRCRTVQEIRWQHCDIKSTSLLGNALLAPPGGAAEEDVLILREGLLAEGSSSNYILVKDGALHTPLADNRMLPGITYQVVCALARAAGIPHHARDIAAAELHTADELWLTSSVREMLPVVNLDGAAVGDGTPGPLFAQVHAAWQQHKDSEEWHDTAGAA